MKEVGEEQKKHKTREITRDHLKHLLSERHEYLDYLSKECIRQEKNYQGARTVREARQVEAYLNMLHRERKMVIEQVESIEDLLNLGILKIERWV